MRETAKTPQDGPDLRLLNVFVAVCELSSFSKAAIELGVTKATVSRSIARLEAELGVELLHRTTHSVSTSSAGAALYERCASHIHALARALSDLPERDESPAGMLRITAPHDFGATVLTEVIAAFRLRCPQVHFDLRLSNDTVDLVAQGFDAAVRAGPSRLADSSLIARKLAKVSARFYASPAYLARRGEPRSYGEPDHEWIEFARGPKPGRASANSLEHALRCDDLTALGNLLLAGAGIGLLPGLMARPHLATGALVPVLPKLEMGAGWMYFVYPSSGQVPRKLSAFRDFLVNALRTIRLD